MGLLFLAIPSSIIFGILLPLQFNWLWFLLGIGIICIGIYTNSSLHELLDGTASVKSAQLLKVDRFDVGARICFGFFHGIGRLTIDNAMCEAATVGATYQLIYSPRSKIAWNIELQTEQKSNTIAHTQPNAQENAIAQSKKLNFAQRKELFSMLIKNLMLTSLFPIYILINSSIDMASISIMAFGFMLGMVMFTVFYLKEVILIGLDLISNPIEIDNTRLIRVKFTYRRGKTRYYAHFENTNRLMINEQQYMYLIENQQYHLSYSLWTRKLWYAQLIDSK
ncbi:hypothetical protein SE18_20270 [Herpetosiphon geysericola]|uniref:Uncharacterized protein n=2 Tax=Herpetosiphon geysericola TaxID=70996 RepID=A0A0P6XF62_9CHLR|nr:hypothetical protein SE18_20270 [Herpetosiphon geysericola]